MSSLSLQIPPHSSKKSGVPQLRSKQEGKSLKRSVALAVSGSEGNEPYHRRAL